MNTLAITDKLIASGTPEPQARAQAQIHEEQSRETKTAIKEEVARATEGFVTRAELADAISQLSREIAAWREDNAKLRREMADRDAVAAWRSAGVVLGGMAVLTAVFSTIVIVAIQSLS